MITYPAFLAAYRDGSLWDDAGWRAYDIDGKAYSSFRRKNSFVQAALKQLGFAAESSQLSSSLHQLKNIYNHATLDSVRTTLVMWQIFKHLQQGRRVTGLQLRELD